MKKLKERDYFLTVIRKMKMKNFIVLLVSIVMLASCGSENANKTVESNDNKVAEDIVQTPDGDHIISSYANGNPKVVKTFTLEGEKREAVYEKEHYEDGNILKEGGLKNGKRHGIWKSYRRDGILWSEGNYDEGMRDGITITYHPNGKKYYEGEYNNGIKSGNWKFYNNQGEVVKEENYDK